MKHLKKFNENTSFDIDYALLKVKEQYSESEVCQMFDDEVLEWVDDNWEDEYESEYDWYVDHNNGEAQDTIITQMINWFKSKYNQDMTIDEYSNLFDSIKNEYDCLK